MLVSETVAGVCTHLLNAIADRPAARGPPSVRYPMGSTPPLCYRDDEGDRPVLPEMSGESAQSSTAYFACISSGSCRLPARGRFGMIASHEQSRRNARPGRAVHGPRPGCAVHGPRPGCAVHGPRPTVETRRRFLAAAAAAASRDEVESPHDGRPPDPAVRTHPMKAQSTASAPPWAHPAHPARGPHGVIGAEKGLS